jgi:hypothetical protein
VQNVGGQLSWRIVSEQMGTLLMGVFSISSVIALGAWGVLMVCLVRLPFNIKPGALTGWLRLNPVNVIFAPERLTDDGKRIRRRLFQALTIFLISLLLGAMSGWMAMRV